MIPRLLKLVGFDLRDTQVPGTHIRPCFAAFVREHMLLSPTNDTDPGQCQGSHQSRAAEHQTKTWVWQEPAKANRCMLLPF